MRSKISKLALSLAIIAMVFDCSSAMAEQTEPRSAIGVNAREPMELIAEYVAEEDKDDPVAKKKRLIAQVRQNIERVEKLQPTWNSKPLKDKLTSIETDAKQGFTGPQNQIHRLACQTPLLDVQLFASAFYLEPFKSGNDTTFYLLFVHSKNNELQDKLQRAAESRQTPSLQQMRDALNQASNAFDIGDTDKANDSYDELIRLAEESADFDVTENVLECYQCFVRGMQLRHRQKPHSHSARQVALELLCIRNDQDFKVYLDSLSDLRNSTKGDELRRVHAALVKSRRSEVANIDQLYKQFVELSNQSGDKTGVAQYFALRSYDAFLTMSRADCDLPSKMLREQLLSARTMMAVGTQSRIRELNEEAGGDWATLESVLKKLEQHSVYVCRSVELFGASSEIMMNTPDPKSPMVYYDRPQSSELWLMCAEASRKGSVCKDCGKRHHKRNSNAPRPAKSLALKLLRESGLKAVPDFIDGIRVTGHWPPLIATGAPVLTDTAGSDKTRQQTHDD